MIGDCVQRGQLDQPHVHTSGDHQVLSAQSCGAAGAVTSASVQWWRVKEPCAHTFGDHRDETRLSHCPGRLAADLRS
ncbi:hypothetical protein GCM10010472_25820 [Pseudonocardia halophobica]|uniref:Uncharacterized protein n=1 Tax=Pseudonocardia halophobica TaxID=29401 RepID=A0A9W6LA94_9PSEU|nr:hypothetical protein GCM10017577_58670 [Pseudonocardia halophobica]